MQEQRGVLSAFDLKCIAILTMLIDHIGAFLYPSQLWMRYVGRLAFPIYCFLIVEGYYHTRNVEKYLLRLLVFALLSELPFDLASAGVLINASHQNVFFTLALGLLCVCAIDRGGHWRVAFLFAVAAVTHFFIKPDYGLGGILMIVCFYLFRSRMVSQWLSIGALNCLCYGGIQGAATLALVPISLYNGKKGPSSDFIKYFFYAFYPLHLLCLYLIRRYLFNVI